jgi:tetratricopeptide (TPR) repeat protein
MNFGSIGMCCGTDPSRGGQAATDVQATLKNGDGGRALSRGASADSDSAMELGRQALEGGDAASGSMRLSTRMQLIMAEEEASGTQQRLSARFERMLAEEEAKLLAELNLTSEPPGSTTPVDIKFAPIDDEELDRLVGMLTGSSSDAADVIAASALSSSAVPTATSAISSATFAAPSAWPEREQQQQQERREAVGEQVLQVPPNVEKQIELHEEVPPGTGAYQLGRQTRRQQQDHQQQQHDQNLQPQQQQLRAMEQDDLLELEQLDEQLDLETPEQQRQQQRKQLQRLQQQHDELDTQASWSDEANTITPSALESLVEDSDGDEDAPGKRRRHIYSALGPGATHSAHPSANATALLHAGIEQCYAGKFADSRALLKLCIKAARAVRDEQLMARGAVNLANVYELTGNSSKAAALYQISMALLRRSGDLSRERLVISNAVTSLVRIGRYKHAAQACQRQIEILEMQRLISPDDAMVASELSQTMRTKEELDTAMRDGRRVSFAAKDPAQRVLLGVRAAG